MSSKNKQTSTQTTTLPGNQQANVDLLQQGAGNWFNTGGPRFYGGNTVAQPNANVTGGQNAQLQAAQGVGGLLNTSMQGEQFWMDPRNIFNPSNIPGFEQAMKSVTQDTTRNLTENVLPGLRSGSVASGMYGGSRQGIGEGLAVGRTSDAITRQLADMQMGAFDRGLNMYNAAQNRLPQTLNNQLMPGQVQQQIGAQQQAQEQQNINADRERWEFEQMAPLFALQQLQQLTGTAGQYGGTVRTQNVQRTGFNPMQAVGGVASLAGGAGAMGWTPFA